jgi:hypothetical protein
VNADVTENSFPFIMKDIEGLKNEGVKVEVCLNLAHKMFTTDMSGLPFKFDKSCTLPPVNFNAAPHPAENRRMELMFSQGQRIVNLHSKSSQLGTGKWSLRGLLASKDADKPSVVVLLAVSVHQALNAEEKRVVNREVALVSSLVDAAKPAAAPVVLDDKTFDDGPA